VCLAKKRRAAHSRPRKELRVQCQCSQPSQLSSQFAQKARWIPKTEQLQRQTSYRVRQFGDREGLAEESGVFVEFDVACEDQNFQPCFILLSASLSIQFCLSSEFGESKGPRLVESRWNGGDEGGVPEVNASCGKVGKLKFWSGICAALACAGSTGCWEERTSVFELRYGAAIFASLTASIFVLNFLNLGFYIHRRVWWKDDEKEG
jgi:hypothetical protein